jgi:hypothetical protein
MWIDIMEDVFNVTNIISEVGTLPGLNTLIWILQTAGIIFIAYIIFLFIQGAINYKKFSKIKKIEKTLEEINTTLKKLDKTVTNKYKTRSKN